MRARVPLPTRALFLAAMLATVVAMGADAGPMIWERVETEHFLFVFEPRDRASVDELLGICEGVYEKVTGFFRSYPKKVPCVVLGRLDYANGYTAPFPIRIELILTAPNDDETMGARSESWLKDLLTHELTHFVHLTMDRGLFYYLSLVFGLDARGASALFIPGWMIEGPAVELETRFTAGGRGRNPYFEAYWKAPFETGSLFSLSQAGFDSAFPPPGRIYVAGYFLVDYLLSRFGEDAFTRVMDEYLCFPFFGPWAAFEKIAGMNASDIFDDLTREWSDKAKGVSPAGGKLFTPDRIADYTHPQATARGVYLYRRDPEHYPAIVLYDPRTGSEKEPLRVSLSDPFSFSSTADGRTVYFTTLEYDYRTYLEEAVSDLYVLDVESGAVRRVTDGGHLWHPAVSKDGGIVVAVQGRGSFARLVEVDVKTGGIRALFSREGAEVFTPAISPDAKRAAFIVNLRGFQDLYVMDLEEARRASTVVSDPRTPVTDVNLELARPVLGPDSSGEYHPAFSSDGGLLFSSDRTGSLCLYSADPESGGISFLLGDPISAYSGIESGGSILYGSYSSKGACIKEAAMTGLSPLPLETGSEPVMEYPAALDRTGSGVASTTYVDLPIPYLWYPSPSLAVTSPSGMELGFGLAAQGASLLQASSWTALAAFLPWSLQPLASAAANVSLGSVDIGYTLDFTYAYSQVGEAGRFDQDLTNKLVLTVPFSSSWAFDRGTSFTMSAGLLHLAELSSDATFTFADTLAVPIDSWGAYLGVLSGIAYRYLTAGGELDFFPLFEINASLGNETMPPILSASDWGSLFNFFFSLSFPSPVSHHVIKLGVKASYGIGSLLSSADTFVTPRGLFDPLSHLAPGRLLGSLDYLIPIALLDLPLPLGWALLGIAAGVHVEALAEWDLEAPSFLPDASLYAGAELTLLLSFANQSYPLGIGLSARIDVTNPASFALLRDLRPYAYLSFDSFLKAMSAGACPPSDPRQYSNSPSPVLQSP